jgi:hypothetical protein
MDDKFPDEERIKRIDKIDNQTSPGKSLLTQMIEISANVAYNNHEASHRLMELYENELHHDEQFWTKFYKLTRVHYRQDFFKQLASMIVELMQFARGIDITSEFPKVLRKI